MHSTNTADILCVMIRDTVHYPAINQTIAGNVTSDLSAT